jgi:hypothetical protein
MISGTLSDQRDLEKKEKPEIYGDREDTRRNGVSQQSLVRDPVRANNLTDDHKFKRPAEQFQRQ